MKLKKIAVMIIAGLLFLFLSGCPEKSTPPDPDGISWDIGTITDYTVSGGSGYEFAEAITGGTFIFPEGADGELSVAVINSGPTPPLSGSMFWIEYDGDDPVQLSLPMGDNEYLYLHGFGSSNGSFDDAIDADERWHALPIVDSAGGNVVFHLSMPFDVARFRPMRSSHRGFTHYQIAAIPFGSSRADTIAAAHAQALDLINNVLDSLPTAIQATARTEVHGTGTWEGRLRPRFYTDGNYYKGFFYWTSLWPSASPMIGLYPFTSGGFVEDVIAHEVGHYINHVLVGDATYVILEAQAPSATHGLGDVHANRSSIVEDYAYFAEYFLTGSVGTSVDPTYNISVLKTGSPYSIDFPSIEGFGCFLLSSLHRTSPVIPSLMVSGTLDSIPVVGASFRDIWGVAARGATNVNQLRTHVEEYLTGVGKEDMLPVIAQRIGWRYRGNGTVMTDDGTGNMVPLEDATVVQIANVGGREYRNSASTTTDSLGNFTISDLFPGTTSLRIYWQTDSTEHPLVVNWDTPTTQTLELGTFFANTSLIDLLQTMDAIKVQFRGDIRLTNDWLIEGNGVWSFTQYGWDYVGQIPISWSGNTATVDGTIVGWGYFDHDIDMTVNFSPTGGSILSVEAVDNLTARPGTGTTGTRYCNLEFNNLPFVSISSNSRIITYMATGNVQSHVDEIEYEVVGGTSGDYSVSAVEWSSTDTVFVTFELHNP